MQSEGAADDHGMRGSALCRLIGSSHDVHVKPAEDVRQRRSGHG